MPWTRQARSQQAESRLFSATIATRGGPSPREARAAAIPRRRRSIWAYVQRGASGRGDAWRKTLSGWAATRWERSVASEYPEARIAPKVDSAQRVRAAASGNASRNSRWRVASRYRCHVSAATVSPARARSAAATRARAAPGSGEEVPSAGRTRRASANEEGTSTALSSRPASERSMSSLRPRRRAGGNVERRVIPI